MKKRLKKKEKELIARLKKELANKTSLISAIKTEIENRNENLKPTTYGLPDLLFKKKDDESKEQFIERQDQKLRECVEKFIVIRKEGRAEKVVLIPEMFRLIADFFFGRERRGVLWKPRGGGGSLAAAILIFLTMIYHGRAWTDLAGSNEQAHVVYDYVTSFFQNLPKLSAAMLAKPPMISRTELKNGGMVACLASSEKQVRGKHTSGVLLDEVSMKGEGGEIVMTAAMQGAMSEPDPLILALSTFHHPIGLFQELWDFADERGFKKYKWNIFDCMSKCTAPCKCIDCPLTEKKKIEVELQNGLKVEKEVITGCNGKARKSCGFLHRRNILETKQMNKGTDVFRVEFENERPMWMRAVYETKMIDNTKIDVFAFDPSCRKRVGIDWGFETEGSCFLILTIRGEKKVGVIDAVATSKERVEQIVTVLKGWKRDYGDFIVMADSSHPFNNAEVEYAGFEVVPVSFSIWKEIGITNVQRYLAFERLEILASLTVLINQLKAYRRGKTGKTIKKADHGPDSLLSFLDPKVQIYTPDGWKAVGHLNVGDLVLTHKGRFKKIIAYKPTPYLGDEVILNLVGREHLVDAYRTTLEHPYLLEDGTWKRAEFLKQGDRVMFLATRCGLCDKKIPYNRKFCDICVGKGRNARWQNPSEKTEKERSLKSKILKDAYVTGLRDGKENFSAATMERARQMREDPIARKKAQDAGRVLAMAVNTPEKLKRQSELMKKLHQRPGYFDYLRTPEMRKKLSARCKDRMEKGNLIPFNARMKDFTDIEILMRDEFSKRELYPEHNFRVRRWWIDFAFSDMKIGIECDGAYWHSSELRKKKDKYRDKKLREEGWTIFRFSDTDIKKDVSACVDKVIRIMTNHLHMYEFCSVEIASVKVMLLKKKKLAYHFEVEEDKSYIARGLVSHNCALLGFPFHEEFPECLSLIGDAGDKNDEESSAIEI